MHWIVRSTKCTGLGLIINQKTRSLMIEYSLFYTFTQITFNNWFSQILDVYPFAWALEASRYKQ